MAEYEASASIPAGSAARLWNLAKNLEASLDREHACYGELETLADFPAELTAQEWETLRAKLQKIATVSARTHAALLKEYAELRDQIKRAVEVARIIRATEIRVLEILNLPTDGELH